MSDPREAELLEQIRARDERVVTLERERVLLQQRVDQLLRQLYGIKSEKIDPCQLQMLFQELQTPGPARGNGSSPELSEALSPRPRKAAPRRQRLLESIEDLPVIEEVIRPLQVQAEPEAWREIDREVSVRLDYEPAKLFRRRIVRPKYVRRGEVDPVPLIAKLPPCILERSILTAGLAAYVLVSKYCHHLPLYRLESIFRTHHRVPLTRQVLAEWVRVCADWLGLIYEAIRQEVLAGGYVQADETPIPYLAPGHGKTKTGYFWTIHRPGGDVFFDWQTSRAAACLEKIIPVDFHGIIQCDGYAGYDAFGRQRGAAIELVGCWTHVRRKFFEALDQAPSEAALVLHLLQNLYRTEIRLRTSRAGPKLRALTRQSEARPVVDRLYRILVHWKRHGRFFPRSLMGKAISYALDQWPSLLPYLSQGQLEIDTNLVENAIRPTAVGKKNWLFIGEANAGERSAIIYTIIESCRRRNIDPYEYLRDVLSRLPSATNWQIKDLTPAAWAALRSASGPLKAAA